MDNQILLTPGPTPIPPETLAQEALPIIHHRTKEFADLFNESQKNLQQVFVTKRLVLTLASSGTGAMECAVANTVSPGDKVIVASIGAFGERWVKILNIFGANVVALRSEWGTAVKPAELEECLKQNPDTKIVSAATDTSTATASDIKSYGNMWQRPMRYLLLTPFPGWADGTRVWTSGIWTWSFR